MLKISCIVCGEDVEMTIDELLDLEDDEVLCPDCSTAAFIFCTDDRIIPN